MPSGLHGAGGVDLAPLVLHHAHPAGTVNRQFRIIAEGGHTRCRPSGSQPGRFSPRRRHPLAVNVHNSLCHGTPLLTYWPDGAEGTIGHTGAAVDALLRIDDVDLLAAPVMPPWGSSSGTCRSPCISPGRWWVGFFLVADGTVVVHYMGQIFIPEILQRALDGLAGALPQAAQAVLLMVSASSSSRSRSSSVPLLSMIRSRISSIRLVPSGRGRTCRRTPSV